MKCDKAQEFCSEYIEDTLVRPMTVALETHLNGCEQCSADVAGLKQMFAVLDKVPQVEPPCPECLKSRADGDGKTMWCARHQEHHPRPHAYHWEGQSVDSVRAWGFD